MEGSWEEELDIDDGDIHAAIDSLRPCSNKSILFCSDSAKTSTLTEGILNPSIDPIPGPAGVLQSSMILRPGNYTPRFSASDPPSSLDHASHPVDSDFLGIPWLTALDFVRDNGLILGTIKLGESIGSIRKLTEVGRVPQVVGIVTSCKPNGLGDLTVMLKDLSGSMVGSIHHKVLQGGMGGSISVGSVLVLQKVVPVEIGREGRSEDERVVSDVNATGESGGIERAEAAEGENVEKNMRGCLRQRGGVEEVEFSRGGVPPQWTDEQLDELLIVDDCCDY